ncbi:hypothetical protein FDZ71_07855, partial [bacterium]
MAEVTDITARMAGRDSGATDKALFIRTSGMEIVEWNHRRIVDTLVRETYIDEDTAKKVADAVQKVIMTSKIEVLTAPLVRELVDA